MLATLVTMAFYCKITGNDQMPRPFVLTCKCRVSSHGKELVNWDRKVVITEVMNVEKAAGIKVNSFYFNCKEMKDDADLL